MASPFRLLARTNHDSTDYVCGRNRHPRMNPSQKPYSNESTPPSESVTRGLSGWSAATFVSGLIIICFAVLVLGLTSRTSFFWLSRDDYIRTELTVTDLDPGTEDSDATLSGTVTATGKEIHTHHIPQELFEFDSPNDPIGTHMDAEKARGKRIPIWFAEDHQSFFSSARIQYVSEYDSLPDFKLVLKTAAVGLALFVAGIWLMCYGTDRPELDH